MNELEALRQENAAQRRQLSQILEQNAQLVEQLARLNERVAELLAVAQRKQRKSRPASETSPPAAPPIVEAEQRRAFEERPKAPEKPDIERGEKQKAKPTGDKARILDPYRDFIRATVEQYPRLRATRLLEMLRGRGYSGSVFPLRRYIQLIRPVPGDT